MKVGDYVRTKKGISKITTIQDEQARKIIYTDTKEVFEYYLDYKGNEIKDYWLNYSSNIIDLIEIGDIIKIDGIDEVREVFEDNFFEDDTRAIVDNLGFSRQIINFNIKSIVTKEQFKGMEYKL